jgi:CRISPR type I-E-associated protein CasB/Cse2
MRMQQTGTNGGHPATEWWTSLQQDAASRAMLRRAHSALEAATVPAAIALARRLGAAKDPDPARFLMACELARVLAWVRDTGADVSGNIRPTLMRAVGWPQFPADEVAPDARPRLAEARFRRVLRAEEISDFAEQCIRLVRLADGRIDVTALARDFQDWCTPGRADRVKQRWAYEYFNAGHVAPGNDLITEPTP